jgi:LysR family nitrogen assimilation transcriptional regulator
VDTTHLRAFLKIAHTGSISRAAESLGIAQPSLSQQLLRLEDEVGIQLFDRTARGVTLTEAGCVFRERARQLLQMTEQAVADARNLRDEARGQVVFAMPPSIARLISVPLLEALAEHSPLVRIRVVESFTGPIRGWLESEKIDLGILYDLGILRHLVAQRLASDELFVVGPPGRFGSADAPTVLPFAALAGESLFAPGPQNGLRQLLEREAVRTGIDLRIAQDVDALDTMIGLAAGGRGLAVLPQCAVAQAVSARLLSVARLSDKGLRRYLSIVRNPAHVLTYALVHVENLTRVVMARLIAEGRWQGRLETVEEGKEDGDV